jgi:hypothetical protein
MLPAPDFWGVTLFFWALVASIPILLAGILAFLAGCTGVEAGARLGKVRYLVAVTASCALGWLILAAVFCCGVWVSGLWAFPSFALQLLAIGLIILLSSVLGATGAYHAGRLVSRSLAWYTCKACGLRFRSPYGGAWCRGCLNTQERTEAKQLAESFSTSIQDLGKRGPTRNTGG